MAAPKNPLIVIPARLAATRLANKPLAEIGGVPMIVHVWRRAIAAKLGPVVVAAADQAIHDVIRAAGGEAVLTDPALPSGSDRVFEALMRFDHAGRHDAVVNLQGDLPAIAPEVIAAALRPLGQDAVDIGTLAAPITNDAEASNANVVKVVLALDLGADQGRALYFSRARVPANVGPLWHHIGIYAYRRAALVRFVKLAPSPLETREKLEQLRALEAGMRIDAALVDSVPIGVDTPADLERIRRILAPG